MQSDIHFKMKGIGDASTEIQYGIPTEITTSIDVNSTEYQLKKYRESEEGNSRTKMEDRDGIVKLMQKK